MRALYEGLDAWRQVPFDWPTANCCHFAKDMCARMGRDIPIEIPELRGWEDADAWLREQGYRGLYGLLRSLFGNPVAPLQGMRGDLVVRVGEFDGGAIGVLDRQAWFLGSKGLIEIPRSQCRWAFRVRSG